MRDGEWNMMAARAKRSDCALTRLTAYLKDSTYKKQEAVTANKVSFYLNGCNIVRYIPIKIQT
jgi:hypothetical protein